MTSTIWLLTILFGLLAAALLIQALFLRWGLKWAKIATISFGRAVLLAIIIVLVNSTITLCFASFTPVALQQELASDFAQSALQVLISCAILARIFNAGLGRAFLGWLPSLIPSAVMLVFIFLVLRPLVYEAYIAPTNSMAPTLLGEHCIGTCPRCGEPAYGFAPRSPEEISPEGYLLICSKELRSCWVADVAGEIGPPDHFLVSKLSSPRRWDVIVFRLPADPAVAYVKRLVGLPGEELLLRDGAVWIDGTKLEPPGPLRGIEYLSSIEWGAEKRLGAGSTPVKLGPDEFFVLGDFSAQAADSRFWETGAPGHAPYAVPESHIIGVVTHIYWPISRWRVLR
jgi:signal peptidase I